MQHAREEEIAERKAMKRAERDIARKKVFVGGGRLQIEDKGGGGGVSPPPPPPAIAPLTRAWSLAPALHYSNSTVNRVVIGVSQHECTPCMQSLGGALHT